MPETRSKAFDFTSQPNNFYQLKYNHLSLNTESHMRMRTMYHHSFYLIAKHHDINLPRPRQDTLLCRTF